MSVLAPASPPPLQSKPPSRRTPAVAAALITAVLALALAALTYWLAVWTSFGQLLDQYVLDAVRRSSAVAHVPYLVTVDAVTDVRLWLGAAALAVIGSMSAVFAGRARFGRTFGITASLLVFPLVVVVIVRTLRDGVLTRPQLHDWITETSNSAPSGHAAAAMSCVVVLIAASPVWLRPVTAAIGGTWAAVIAFGLIADGWHRPSDVVISVLLVVGFGMLLPDPHTGATPLRGTVWWRAAAFLATVIATPVVVAVSYPDERQILTSVGVAVAISAALAIYRPCSYRRSDSPR